MNEIGNIQVVLGRNYEAVEEFLLDMDKKNK